MLVPDRVTPGHRIVAQRSSPKEVMIMSIRTCTSLFLTLFVALLILSGTGCPGQEPTIQDTSETQTTAPADHPSVEIISPAEGEVVKARQVTVRIETKNFRVATPGGAPVPGEGHFHVILDDAEPNITDNDTVTFPVTSGTHTIKVVLVNNDHTDFSPPVATTVDFSVETP